MKKVYQTIAAISLSVLTVGAFGQNANNFIAPQKRGYVKTFTGKLEVPKISTSSVNRIAITPSIFLDWDSADAQMQPTYNRNQGVLMNAHYKYPADTGSGIVKNYDCINFVTVAFDTMYDAPTQTGYGNATTIKIDTLYVPIAQINHSSINDTLDVKVTAIDAGGYPTSTLIKDTMFIGTMLGGLTANSISIYHIGLNKTITAKGFAVTLTYLGSKMDSCYFIYGYGYFTGPCPGGSYALAYNTNWSNIYETQQFKANSFELWNQYVTDGILPTNTGADIYYDCNANSQYDPGIDGASYIQNIDIWALVDINPPLGMERLASKSFSVGQNYPNPFSKSTEIAYNLTQSSNVGFSVCDITGRQLVHNNYTTVAPGRHVITLQANQFTPGVYFYTFNVNGVKVTNKMIITQ